MAKSWYPLPFQNDGRSRSSACCRLRNGNSNSSDVYRRPVESITVFFISPLYEFRCGWICYEHPLQSTAIPHIMGGWML